MIDPRELAGVELGNIGQPVQAVGSGGTRRPLVWILLIAVGVFVVLIGLVSWRVSAMTSGAEGAPSDPSMVSQRSNRSFFGVRGDDDEVSISAVVGDMVRLEGVWYAVGEDTPYGVLIAVSRTSGVFGSDGGIVRTIRYRSVRSERSGASGGRDRSTSAR